MPLPGHIDIRQISRPAQGLGFQGRAPIPDWAEAVLIIWGDHSKKLEQVGHIPPSQRPMALLRFYHGSLMESEDPEEWGRQCARNARWFAEQWGPNFIGMQIENELNLAREHGFNDEDATNHRSAEFWAVQYKFGDSHQGWQEMSDYMLAAYRAADEEDGDIDFWVGAFAPGWSADGPDVLRTGFYGWQQSLYGRIVRMPRRGTGFVGVLYHGYWYMANEKGGQGRGELGLRDFGVWGWAYWEFERLNRPKLFKDNVQEIPANDPGGLLAIFSDIPDLPVIWGEWNSAKLSEGDIEEEYKAEVSYALWRFQGMRSTNLKASFVFLWEGEGQRSYTHADHPAGEAFQEVQNQLAPIAFTGAPPPKEEPMLDIYDAEYDQWQLDYAADHGLPPAKDMFHQHHTAIHSDEPVTLELVESVRTTRDAASAQLALLEPRLGN